MTENKINAIPKITQVENNKYPTKALLGNLICKLSLTLCRKISSTIQPNVYNMFNPSPINI
jgi:hypothetical protein